MTRKENRKRNGERFVQNKLSHLVRLCSWRGFEYTLPILGYVLKPMPTINSETLSAPTMSGETGFHSRVGSASLTMQKRCPGDLTCFVQTLFKYKKK